MKKEQNITTVEEIEKALLHIEQRLDRLEKDVRELKRDFTSRLTRHIQTEGVERKY